MSNPVTVSAHALQRLTERANMKKPSIDTFKLFDSRKLTFNHKLSNDTRSIYDHLNDNGFTTRYIFNADSSVLLTVIPKGKKASKLHITERELKAKSVVLTDEEVAEKIQEISPELSRKQVNSIVALFNNQRVATAHTFTSIYKNKRKD